LSSLPPEERHTLAPIVDRVVESAVYTNDTAPDGEALDELRVLAASD
jgi:hypothetical protein